VLVPCWLTRYYLGLAWHRLEGFQALVGVVLMPRNGIRARASATVHPIFKYLEKLAAQAGDLSR
jgi:hypothetical protein